GRLNVTTLSFETAAAARRVEVRAGSTRLRGTVVASGNRAVVTLLEPTTITPGRQLNLTLT
ncbi:MAG: hypothetical protein HOV67_27845, partial [Kribbellaceae bacterium]|nr:hypothetical protein [Kribbellaceae bacterium]